ncbi:MAG: DUF2723 domain-containing protein [Gemmatimonadetes bacterium]|nr:DUF2723 domain-containing protein [Gemmatimonadota bacterium]
MSRRGGPGERAYGALLRLYPAAFREEFGEEMVAVYRRQRREDRRAGAAGLLRLWAGLLADLVPAATRERLAVVRERRRSRRAADPYPPPYGEATLAGLAVWALYAVTLAPTIAFWDAGEYTTVAHILGIPHPPGNPLFVFLARSWELLLLPLGVRPVVAVNLFSATLSALAHFLWFLVADRLLRGGSGDRVLRRIAAWSAVLLSATAYTVWSQSNVNEKVYTISLLTVGLVSWTALRWRDRAADARLLLIAGYVMALSVTNHLMGLLAAPALLLFVVRTRPGALAAPRLWAAALPLTALGLSAMLFLPIRAELKPLVLEAEPTCASLGEAAVSIYTWGAEGCDALSSSIRREQYGKPSVLADPNEPTLPRGPGLVAAQVLNYFQYFDWQWGRSVGGAEPVLGGARPLVTLLFLLLGSLGLRTVMRRDRPAGEYLLVLFLTLSLGLVFYLNFRYGWSIGWDAFPAAEDHEVRERDYFFLVGFSVWGLCAGIGLAAAWERLAAALDARRSGSGSARRLSGRILAAPVLALALLPMALNWSWASRADDWTARDWAYNVLMSVEPYGVLVTNGDNDSFPLWYLQKVESIREDVTIVLTPYLNTPWYVKQLRALTTPCAPGVSAADDPTRILCQRTLDPGEIPAALARTGGPPADGIRAPEDSIVPLDDEAIDAIAATAYVAPRDLRLKAGAVDTVIPAGTVILPQDSFISAILQASLGRRPVHFMSPSISLGKLGLAPYAVRQGLTVRISDGPPRVGPRTGIVALPESAFAAATARYVDLPRTDTLLREVYLHRGRIRDPAAPWVDPATTNIPLYYAWAHLAAAQGFGATGDPRAVDHHMTRVRQWEQVIAN